MRIPNLRNYKKAKSTDLGNPKDPEDDDTSPPLSSSLTSLPDLSLTNLITSFSTNTVVTNGRMLGTFRHDKIVLN